MQSDVIILLFRLIVVTVDLYETHSLSLFRSILYISVFQTGRRELFLGEALMLTTII